MQTSRQIVALYLVALLAACGSSDDANRVVGELASDRIELTAEVTEPIVEIVVAEGVAVAAGDILIRQDSDRASARLAEAEAALDQSRARLAELVRGPRREQIDAARANLDGAERDVAFRKVEFVRAQEVESRGLASAETLDRVTANLDAATANLELRRAQLEELLAGTTIEELEQAEAAAKQSAARLDSARVDLERHSLRAPTDGITDSRLFELGERPAQGQPVMVMLGGEQPYARVFVPTDMRVHVSPGTRAQIYVDGLDAPIDGRVRWVAAESAFTPYFALTERDRGRLSFVAKVDIVDQRDRLPDGVPVEVEFID